MRYSFLAWLLLNLSWNDLLPTGGCCTLLGIPELFAFDFAPCMTTRSRQARNANAAASTITDIKTETTT
jgi:hypothetical protein